MLFSISGILILSNQNTDLKHLHQAGQDSRIAVEQMPPAGLANERNLSVQPFFSLFRLHPHINFMQMHRTGRHLPRRQERNALPVIPACAVVQTGMSVGMQGCSLRMLRRGMGSLYGFPPAPCRAAHNLDLLE